MICLFACPSRKPRKRLFQRNSSVELQMLPETLGWCWATTHLARVAGAGKWRFHRHFTGETPCFASADLPYRCSGGRRERKRALFTAIHRQKAGVCRSTRINANGASGKRPRPLKIQLGVADIRPFLTRKDWRKQPFLPPAVPLSSHLPPSAAPSQGLSPPRLRRAPGTPRRLARPPSEFFCTRRPGGDGIT